LKGKKIQLNLNDGRNILADCKCKVNDSVILDLEKKKVLKVLELKDGANALVMEGKHIGEKGKINKIQSEMKMAELEIEGKKFNALIKQLMVLE
jgi:ribosomal protein S4E